MTFEKCRCRKCNKDITNYEENYPYKLCKVCVNNCVKVCTCEKKFITGIPKIIKIENDYYELSDKLPEYLFKQLAGKFYGIEGCKGCKYKSPISIQNDFEHALQSNIYSCVYQKIKDNHHEDFFYEYVSDALNPIFDDYLKENGIKVGENLDLSVTYNN
jgi:hypothetical protein